MSEQKNVSEPSVIEKDIKYPPSKIYPKADASLIGEPINVHDDVVKARWNKQLPLPLENGKTFNYSDQSDVNSGFLRVAQLCDSDAEYYTAIFNSSHFIVE